MEARFSARSAVCAGLIVTGLAVVPGVASAATPYCFANVNGTFSDQAAPNGPRTTTLTAGRTYTSDLECGDTDGDAITLSFTQAPARGTGQFTNRFGFGGLDYKPIYNGTDTFTVRASDGSAFSNPITYTVTVVGGAELPQPQPAPAPAPVVPAPAAPKPAAPAVTFNLKGVPASVTVDSKGTATIPVSGTPGGKGSVSLTATAPKAKASAAAKKKAKTLALGSASFTVPAKGAAKVKVKLPSRGFKALKKAKSLKAKVTVKSGTTTVTKNTKLKAPKAKKKKSKK